MSSLPYLTQQQSRLTRRKRKMATSVYNAQQRRLNALINYLRDAANNADVNSYLASAKGSVQDRAYAKGRYDVLCECLHVIEAEGADKPDAPDWQY